MQCMEIKGARQNNLKNLHIKIPLGHLTVICGPSGSGKSSLAFDTLFTEGYRLYTETLSHFARQYTRHLPRPLLGGIRNIPPALAVEQSNKIRSARPTVATFTELASLLRLLFVCFGEVSCPVHKEPLKGFSIKTAATKIRATFKKGFILTPLFKEGGGTFEDAAYFQAKKKELLKEGFRYVYVEKRGGVRAGVQEISKIKKMPGKNVWLLIDQLDFKESHLEDSLKLARRIAARYAAARAVLKILSTDKKSLFISFEKPCCVTCAWQFPFVLQNAFFNFNTTLGACRACRGFGNHFLLDESKVVRTPWKSLAEGAIEPFAIPSAAAELRALRQFCRAEKISWHSPWEKLTLVDREKIWQGNKQFTGIQGFFDYLESKKYRLPVRVFLSRYKSAFVCKTCKGRRFRKEVAYVTFKGKTLPWLLQQNIQTLLQFFQQIHFSVAEKNKLPAGIRKIYFLLETLNTIGLGYLDLSRPVRSLSSGELQRLSLAHQLGLGLAHTLYVLDEPTVGLHSSDTACLISLLKKLKDQNNTLVVVEHDPDMIGAADFVLEMGPGAGPLGGEIQFSGSGKKFLQSESLTGKYIKNIKKNIKNFRQKPPRPVKLSSYKYFLTLEGCKSHNLKNIQFSLPLNRLVCVTGPSGSGKSTLVTHTLYPALMRAIHKKNIPGGVYSGLQGAAYLRRVVWVNPSPVEKSSRSLPVTYLKIYDSIRDLLARANHLPPRLFSFNVEGGRCAKCRGLGYQEVEMVFMDPVRTLCEQCEGRRFQSSVLKARWKNKNIHQILNMSVKEAMDLFIAWPAIRKPLSLLKKVGLAYLPLGQSLSTLSGGELQRLKLARELMQTEQTPAIYILDEPTTGLHFTEIHLLMDLLHQLVDKGSSVVMIEHNLEVLTRADYLMDMGPAAGPGGGEIVATGSPADLFKAGKGKTSRFLKEWIKS